MKTSKGLGVGELIVQTESGEPLEIGHLPKSFTIEERQAFGKVLQRYHELQANNNKVAVFHALSDYLHDGQKVASGVEAYMRVAQGLARSSLLHLLPPITVKTDEMSATGIVDAIYENTRSICEDIERIENAIASPEKVIVRNDRSVDLGAASAVLSGTYAASHPFGTPHKKEEDEIPMLNTTIRVHGELKTIPVHPLLKGVKSKEDVENGDNARWTITQTAIQARFTKWCEDIAKPSSPNKELASMIRKREIMRVFNTYIDVLAETQSTFLRENETLQSTIEQYKEIIVAELQQQLQQHTSEHVDEDAPYGWKPKGLRIVQKYILAFDELGCELPEEALCDLVAEETPDTELTSQLSEVA